MSKIRFNTDSTGRLVATAQVQTEKGLRRVFATSESKAVGGVHSHNDWYQLTLDLLGRAAVVRDGASKAGIGVQ